MDNEILKWTFDELFARYLSTNDKIFLARTNRAYFQLIFPKIIAETVIKIAIDKECKEEFNKEKRQMNEGWEERWAEKERKKAILLPVSIFILRPKSKISIPKKILQESLIYFIIKSHEKPYNSFAKETRMNIMLSLIKRGAKFNKPVRNVLFLHFFPTSKYKFYILTQYNQWYPLHYAALSGNHEATRLLIRSNAILNVPGDYNVIPIDYAAQLGHRGVVRAMVEETAKREKAKRERDKERKKETKSAQPLENRFRDVVENERRKEETTKERSEKEGEIVEEILKVGRKMLQNRLGHSYNLMQTASYLGNACVVRWMLSFCRYNKKVTVYGLSPMHLAAMAGHTEVLQLLMEGGRWDTQNKNTYFRETENQEGVWAIPPLLVAAHYGHAECVKVLLQKPPKKLPPPHPELRAYYAHMHSFQPSPFLDCRTPLDMAAMAGHRNVVEVLLHHNNSSLHKFKIEDILELGRRSNVEKTPLLFLQAVKEGNNSMARALWEYSEPLYPKIPHSDCFLTAWMPYYDLLSKCPEPDSKEYFNHGSQFMGLNPLPKLPLNQLIEYGVNYTLMSACYLGDMDFVCKALQAQEPNDYELAQSLYIAAERGHEEIIFKILQDCSEQFHKSQNSSPDNHRGNWDFSLEAALKYAAFGGHAPLVEKLLNMVTSKTEKLELEEAFHLACRYGHEEVVQLLLKWGADPNSIFKGCTPLHCAAMGGNANIVRSLLKLGAKVDATVLEQPGRSDGSTPEKWGGTGLETTDIFVARNSLQIALEQSQNEVVVELLRAGASLKIKKDDLYEATTLFFATTRGFPEVVEKCFNEDLQETGQVPFKLFPYRDLLEPLCTRSYSSHVDSCCIPCTRGSSAENTRKNGPNTYI
eukprot:Phypoly_transcript_00985.p1 GENE.Phypoly_transcript_00985~~Phypoly_transcript_00985.p1  ORF type:complete len:871 (+),score=104.82 Phypoly_transcript_00985:94-2706(+)